MDASGPFWNIGNIFSIVVILFFLVPNLLWPYEVYRRWAGETKKQEWSFWKTFRDDFRRVERSYHEDRFVEYGFSRKDAKEIARELFSPLT